MSVEFYFFYFQRISRPDDDEDHMSPSLDIELLNWLLLPTKGLWKGTRFLD